MTINVSINSHQQEDIAERLCDFLRNNIISPEVTVKSDTGLNLLGVDSFSLMEMILFIERCYGLVLPPETLTTDNIATVDSWSQLCAQHLSIVNG